MAFGAWPLAASAQLERGANGNWDEMQRAVDAVLAAHGHGKAPAPRPSWAEMASQVGELRETFDAILEHQRLSARHMKRATELAEAAGTVVPSSGVLEALARLESAADEATTRLAARWDREQALWQRERQLRELEAAQRARGVR